MRVLVTGGCGYVGSVLVPKLLAAGHNVTVVDAQWFGNYLQPHPALRVWKQDIRESLSLEGFEAVIHLASVANDPCCDLDPRLAREVNWLATERLVAEAADSEVRHFIFASSGSVYGISDAHQVTEDMPLVPVSEYNVTKMWAEAAVLSSANRMTVQVLRPGTVCGLSPRMRLDTVVNALTIKALTMGIIPVHGGNQIRPNIHIDDMVDVYMHMLERPELTGVFNAGHENLTVAEIAAEVSCFLPGCTITVEPTNDPRSYRLNSDRLRASGFLTKRTVAKAIVDMASAHSVGRLSDVPQHYNLGWMRKMQVAA